MRPSVQGSLENKAKAKEKASKCWCIKTRSINGSIHGTTWYEVTKVEVKRHIISRRNLPKRIMKPMVFCHSCERSLYVLLKRLPYTKGID